MAFEVEKWVDEALAVAGEEVSAADRAVIVKHFSEPKRAAAIEAGVMRQVDYSKRMDDFSKKQNQSLEEIAAEKKAFQDRMTQLAAWEEEQKKTVANIQARSKELESAYVSREAALKKASAEYGFDMDEYLRATATGGTGSVTGPTGAGNGNGLPDGFDPEKVVTKDELNKILTDIGKQYGQWPVGLQSIQAKHYELFGEILDPREIYDKHIKTGRNLEEIYVEEFKVEEKLKAIEQAELDKKLEAARREGFDAGIKKVTTVPDSHEPGEFHSPAHALSAKIQGEKQGTTTGGPRISAVDRAVRTHVSGKHAKPGSPYYRGPQPDQAGAGAGT